MSDSYGTTLILKRHEDFKKVAAYVKQQVPEKSIEQEDKDLSEDNDYLGLKIIEDKNMIIWRDYSYPGDHFNFKSIVASVIKEFPGVEMELQNWWGPQDIWNYVIVDGKWQEYTLWKFVAYTDGKGEEDQLEYKQLEDGRTEEERHEELDRMCKEMAERLSRLHPDVEIAVYVIDWYENDFGYQVKEYYRAKEGRATKECVDCGLVQIHWECIGMLEWVESRGHVLLHPKEFATELIKRAREGDYDCRRFAIDMLMDGDKTSDTSLIEPADKKWLIELVEKSKLKREEDWNSVNGKDELPR